MKLEMVLLGGEESADLCLLLKRSQGTDSKGDSPVLDPGKGTFPLLGSSLCRELLRGRAGGRRVDTGTLAAERTRVSELAALAYPRI